jgi:hypothetical protein
MFVEEIGNISSYKQDSIVIFQLLKSQYHLEMLPSSAITRYILWQILLYTVAFYSMGKIRINQNISYTPKPARPCMQDQHSADHVIDGLTQLIYIVYSNAVTESVNIPNELHKWRLLSA